MRNPVEHLFSLTLPDTSAGSAVSTALGCIDRGDVAQARRNVVFALEVAKVGQDRYGEAAALTVLAAIDRDRELLQDARDRWRREYPRWQFNHAVTLYLLAWIAKPGDTANAMALLDECINVLVKYQTEYCYEIHSKALERVRQLRLDALDARNGISAARNSTAPGRALLVGEK